MRKSPLPPPPQPILTSHLVVENVLKRKINRLFSVFKGIYEEINRTTVWETGHPFRKRNNIALFISYAKERSCGFKVGRITFNTSLAWFSFFFGLTGLLYHFVQN